jgi:lipoyl(octanoyl) transferase
MDRELNIPTADLGRLDYAGGYRAQEQALERVLAARDAGAPVPGEILLVEHEAVITVSRRPGAARHVLAGEQALARAGVALAETDRGGDVTYHGPGQVVCYPILDLNHLGLRLHDYMRLLESSVIDACARFGLVTHRDASATGVWTGPAPSPESAKVCALGVRVRRWVSMHGLALNVSTNLEHFSLIVPCGLTRPVTSLERALGPAAPGVAQVKDVLIDCLKSHLARAAAKARPGNGEHG